MRTWKEDAWLKKINEDRANDKAGRKKREESIKQILAKEKEKSPPQWFVNGQGQTMVVLPAPVEFVMGSPKSEKDRESVEVQHKRGIKRSFAIASSSVTLEQYRKLTGKYEPGEKYTRFPDLPAVGISWYLAAKYCNLLSKAEGIDTDNLCYDEDDEGTVKKLKPNYLSLKGYRLPNEAEMEYATRAKAVTSRYYGETEELLGNYAWFKDNSNELVQRTGTRKPNDFGLFDALGNCYTWCQEPFYYYPEAQAKEAVEDKEVPKANLVVISTKVRVLRGGSFLNRASHVRSAYRLIYRPGDRNLTNGFRVARTFTP